MCIRFVRYVEPWLSWTALHEICVWNIIEWFLWSETQFFFPYCYSNEWVNFWVYIYTLQCGTFAGDSECASVGCLQTVATASVRRRNALYRTATDDTSHRVLCIVVMVEVRSVSYHLLVTYLCRFLLLNARHRLLSNNFVAREMVSIHANRLHYCRQSLIELP